MKKAFTLFLSLTLMLALMYQPVVAPNNEIKAQEASGITRVVRCSTTQEIVEAFDNAQAGDRIILSAGTYKALGTTKIDNAAKSVVYYHIKASGTKTNPIIIESEDATNPAILKGLSTQNPGYVLYVTGDYVQVQNISISTGAKGIIIDNSLKSTFTNVNVSDVGQEGIHVRDGSKDIMIDGAVITNTGLKDPGFAEGVYIGSDRSVWKLNGKYYDRKVTGTIVKNSTIGAGVKAECLDIKEGTSNTQIIRQ